MSRKVLVVDDEKLIVKGIRFNLEQDGMEVDCAYDGEEAVEKAKENKYDIILLDLMLPKMDGLEVCSVGKFAYKGVGALFQSGPVPIIPVLVPTNYIISGHIAGHRGVISPSRVYHYPLWPDGPPGPVTVVSGQILLYDSHDILQGRQKAAPST